ESISCTELFAEHGSNLTLFFWDCESLADKIKVLHVSCQHKIVPIRFFSTASKGIGRRTQRGAHKGQFIGWLMIRMRDWVGKLEGRWVFFTAWAGRF
ncbi:MAG: hypothetical protein CK530_07345, partial [Planctomycetaceae bacterium]